MKLHFDVATFHRSLEGAADETETEAVVADFVDRQSRGENTTADKGALDLSGARSLVLSLRPVRRETFRERISACLGCEKSNIIVGDAEGGAGLKIIQCTECLCVMNAKARFRGSVCPLGKFDAEVD